MIAGGLSRENLSPVEESMGLDYPSCRFLQTSMRGGARFDATVTLGRQAIYLNQRQRRKLGIRREHIPPMQPGQPADVFFREFLGAGNICALDNSDFEGAEFIHDLNNPIPEALHEKFDAVIDGGTLEHVFNYPQGFWNCVQMAKVGGRIFFLTPGNNFFGHGFYQLSPELFFSLCHYNPCIELLRMIAVGYSCPVPEWGCRHRYFKVESPYVVGSRIMLLSKFEGVGLLVEIAKKSHAPSGMVIPQQSDYVTRWTELEQNTSNIPSDVPNASVHRTAAIRKRSLARRLLKPIWVRSPQFVKRWVGNCVLRHFEFNFRNKRHFSKIRDF